MGRWDTEVADGARKHITPTMCRLLLTHYEKCLPADELAELQKSQHSFQDYKGNIKVYRSFNFTSHKFGSELQKSRKMCKVCVPQLDDYFWSADADGDVKMADPNVYRILHNQIPLVDPTQHLLHKVATVRLYLEHEFVPGKFAKLAVVSYYSCESDEAQRLTRMMSLSRFVCLDTVPSHSIGLVPVHELYARAVFTPVPHHPLVLAIPMAREFIPFGNQIRVNPQRDVFH